MLIRPLTFWQKVSAFLRKPTKLSLIEERVDQWNRTKKAEAETYRVKEWLLLIIDQANRGASTDQVKAMLSCAILGLSVKQVVNFNKSDIPQEIQK